MKTILTIIITVLAVSAFSQSDTWRLGVHLGFHGSQATYAGGMTDAHARFSGDGFCAPALDIAVRHDLNDHLMFLSGLGFSQTGFYFAIAENYSLLCKERKYTSISSSVPVVQIPVLAAYKTNLNCRNIRYFIGCGLVMNSYGDTVNTSYTVIGNEVSMPDTSYLNSDIIYNGKITIAPRFIAGCEKVFKNGSMLSASFLAQFGSSELMNATVNYTIDGTRYWHKFTNNGSYCGIVFSWYFRNFGWKKQQYSTLEN